MIQKCAHQLKQVPVLTQPPLADAQLVVAREYGVESWSQLKRYSENQRLYQSEDLTDGQNQYVNGRLWEEQEARLRKLASAALHVGWADTIAFDHRCNSA